ncbi:MAG: hypothetical protein ACYS7Y_18910 [Planctomycetota bacterium]|jgi:hypothetical protein
MKNSKAYSKKIQALYRTLGRKHPKVQEAGDGEVTDAIIYAIVSSELVKKLADLFVDWNDLRVSRVEEIVDVLHKDTRATRSVAANLLQVLNGIFNQYHKVSLETLKKTGKRPARQALEKIDGISRFVVDYCMLMSLHGHAIPLTEKMLEYLRNNDLVDADADEQQVGGFLAKQIPAKNGYEFYALLRHESETSKSVKKNKDQKNSESKKEEKENSQEKESLRRRFGCAASDTKRCQRRY